MERLLNFINELEELTKKYNFTIGACGCCYSPWIVDLKGEYKDVFDLQYDEDKEKYKYCYDGVWYE